MRFYVLPVVVALALAAVPSLAAAAEQTVTVNVIGSRADSGTVNFEKTGGQIGAKLVSGPPGAKVQPINAVWGDQRAYSVQILLAKPVPSGTKVTFAVTAPSPNVCYNRGGWSRGLEQGWNLKRSDVTGIRSCR
jgi:hypothetical protein